MHELGHALAFLYMLALDLVEWIKRKLQEAVK